MNERFHNRTSKKVANNILFLLIVSALFVFTLTNYSFAVPASPELSDMVQPDGNTLKVKQRGDEWNNRFETTHGYTVKKHRDGYWKYISKYTNGTPVFSNSKAHRQPPQGLSRHVRSKKVKINTEKGVPLKRRRLLRSLSGESDSFSSSGGDGDIVAAGGGDAPSQAPSTFNGPVLFILTEFSDRSGTYTESSFADFITNNISDYFDKASYGNVSLSSANETFGTANNGVVGWVNVGYAHPNTGSSTGTANRQLSRDAIIAADAYVDFSAYDGNSDGYVDSDELAVVIIAAGFERSYSSSYTPNVWGHKWSVGGTVVAPVVDGVTVGAYHSGAGGYAQFGEIHQSSVSNGHQATMGIMVHELGHLIFGLPDLYDTDGSSNGIGAFGIMASGSWGKANSDTNSGETPVLPSAWSKANQGWITENTIVGAGTIYAAGSASATDSNTVFKLITGQANEYFLVENRQPEGYDRGLERWLGAGFGGLAIWHIDDNKTNNTAECAPPSDCSTNHFMVSLEQADGSWDLENDVNSGNITDLWYSGNLTVFDENSTPDSNLYSGSTSSSSVTAISASGSTMTATFGLYSFGLTITSAGTGSGTISSSPAGIDCGGDCLQDYPDGEVVTLTATPDTGSTFTGWSGEADCSDGTVTMSADVNCTATFTLQTFSLALTKAGAGSGTVTSSPAGINCGGDCTETYNYGTVVTLTGTPAAESTFAGWSGDADCSDGTVTVNSATNCTATFNVQQYTLTTTASPLAGGSINPDCSGGCLYDSGTLVVLSATENADYLFDSWTSCDSSSGNSCTMTMNATKNVTANFQSCLQPARIVDTPYVYYATLQDAYDAALTGDSIQSQDVIFLGDHTFDLNKSVTITGGYSCDYSSITGTTTINGDVTIDDGTVTLDDLDLTQ